MIISLEQLSEIFSDVLDEEIQVSYNSTQNELESWDSLNHLNLIVELEGRLQVRFTTDEIEKMKSVTEIMKILDTK